MGMSPWSLLRVVPGEVWDDHGYEPLVYDSLDLGLIPRGDVRQEPNCFLWHTERIYLLYYHGFEWTKTLSVPVSVLNFFTAKNSIKIYFHVFLFCKKISSEKNLLEVCLWKLECCSTGTNNFTGTGNCTGYCPGKVNNILTKELKRIVSRGFRGLQIFFYIDNKGL